MSCTHIFSGENYWVIKNKVRLVLILQKYNITVWVLLWIIRIIISLPVWMNNFYAFFHKQLSHPLRDTSKALLNNANDLSRLHSASAHYSTVWTTRCKCGNAAAEFPDASRCRRVIAPLPRPRGRPRTSAPASPLHCPIRGNRERFRPRCRPSIVFCFATPPSFALIPTTDSAGTDG